MHKYCLDTSGISNPVLEMPDEIFVSLWDQVTDKIENHVFCWNIEIFDELSLIPGRVGDSIKVCNKSCCYEVGIGSWPWVDYIGWANAWRNTYKEFISEYNGNRKNTISSNDLSIVALAKTLNLPVLSMEKRNVGIPSQTKLRIPDLCDRVSVDHLTFNEFLYGEGIRI